MVSSKIATNERPQACRNKKADVITHSSNSSTCHSGGGTRSYTCQAYDSLQAYKAAVCNTTRAFRRNSDPDKGFVSAHIFPVFTSSTPSVTAALAAMNATAIVPAQRDRWCDAATRRFAHSYTSPHSRDALHTLSKPYRPLAPQAYTSRL